MILPVLHSVLRDPKWTRMTMRADLCTAILCVAAVLCPTEGRCKSPPDERPTIRRILIEGNRLIPDAMLKRLMETKETGFLVRSRFEQTVFEEDLDALETFYQNSGFLDARIVRWEVSPAPKEGAVDVSIVLEEGDRWTVEDVRVEGNRRLGEGALKNAGSLRPDEPFKRLLVLKDCRALRILCAENALIDARVRPSITYDDARKRVTLTYEIHEGEPVRVGQVLLEGLDKTTSTVVLRELALHAGEMYDYSKIAKTQNNLHRTGLFRSVRVEPVASDTLGPSRDLLISVSERPGGAADIGIGYGTSEGIRASLELVQSNWRGRGIRVGLRSRVSLKAQRSEVSLTLPWLLGTRTITDMNAFYDREDRPSFVVQRAGLTASLSRRFTESVSMETGYTLERVKLLSVKVGTDTTAGRGSTSDLFVSLVRDTRNDLLNPTRGELVRAKAEYAGEFLRGTNPFFRSQVTLALFRSLGHEFVVALSVRVGFIKSRRSGYQVPLYERFLLGGDRSVRGFNRHALGAPYGGNAAFSFQSEIRFPFWRMGGVLFLDGGGVWPHLDVIDPTTMRIGFGGGLRYASPFGVLRADMAFRRGVESLWSRTEVYIGLGQAF